METSPYRLPIILGIVLALLTWLILSLVPKQAAPQKMWPELPNSAQPDTIIQITGEPLIKQPDVISINADTTALANRQRINSAHVYVHKLDSLHLPPLLNELRITEHTNLTVASRELYVNRIKGPTGSSTR